MPGAGTPLGYVPKSLHPKIPNGFTITEHLVVHFGLSDWDVLVDTDYNLMRLGLSRTEVQALREEWSGLTEPLPVDVTRDFITKGAVTVTARGPIGADGLAIPPPKQKRRKAPVELDAAMAALATGDLPMAAAVGAIPSETFDIDPGVVVSETHQKLGTRRIFAGGSPAERYAFAKELYDIACLEPKLHAVAHECGVTLAQATVIRRRYARLLAELKGIPNASEDDAIRLWTEEWGVHPDLLRAPWTISPPAMLDLYSAAGGVLY
jgi:hypothetical protein